MAQTLGVQDQRVLDGTAQIVYTTLTNQTYIPKTIVFCNLTINISPSPTFNVWILPDGVSVVADQYKIVNSKTIASQETIFINPDIYLQAGYKVVVQASVANTIACTLSGVVIS